MKFIFIRHGEATHNVAYRECKNEAVFSEEKYKDAPLTEKGIQEARDLANKLRDQIGDKTVCIWSSPLTRAIQTAEELFEELNVGNEIYLHDGLLEFQGVYQKCNARISTGDLKKKFCTINTKFLPELPAFWLQNEPVAHYKHRMKMVLHMIKEVCLVDTVIIVSHKNVLFSILEKDLKNCEFVEKTYEELV
jgi:broad specificity phosphatase PhoE